MVDKVENNETLDGTENIEGIKEEKPEPPEIDSKYRLILLAAQRCKQLQKGAKPRINVDPRKVKPTRIALEELKQKKIYFELTEDV
jgi:DNA-directed RNA polymerase, omega subunit